MQKEESALFSPKQNVTLIEYHMACQKVFHVRHCMEIYHKSREKGRLLASEMAILMF